MLAAINVGSGNTVYSSQDGVLYNKAKTTLILYPRRKTGTFTIPDSVTSIENSAFSNCEFLTAINVGSGNTAYSSQDGVLYNKAKTTLILYPAGKPGSAFTIPAGVTSIEDIAFSVCSLTSVTIPASVTSIGNGAFSHCYSLTSVTFTTGSNISDSNFGYGAFPEGEWGWGGGNSLKNAYLAANPKAGTYTRAANGDVWTK